MAYIITTSERSPFGRICRMFMIRNQIAFQTEFLNYLDNPADTQALSRQTPINKVPLLKDGQQVIFDSRVIVNYLTQKHRLASLTIAEENIVSAIYSCLDTSVMLFLLKRDGLDISGPQFYVRRSRERIPNNLKFVKAWADGLDPANNEHWNYASISLYSYLFWARKRGLLEDLHAFPELTRFLAKFAEAPGVRETTFD